jgi:hypothetical protein
VQTESNVKATSAASVSHTSDTEAKTDQKLHQSTKQRVGKKNNRFSEHKPSDQMDEYIELINNNPHVFKWEANKCLL